MATKHTDGCFQKAEDDEPLFTLLARDEFSASLVIAWALQRQQVEGNSEKVRDAFEVANAMQEWRLKNRPVKREIL